MNRRAATLALAMAMGALGAGCTVGEGTGWVRATDKLYIEDCWDGPFDLNPDFFGANPYRDSLMIRIQRGDNVEEMSDGLIIVVKELAEVRKQLGQWVKVGLPAGVSPPGVPIVEQEDPPKVNLSLYLHNACHAQNATVQAIGGEIMFTSLFTGNVNASRAEDRLTRAEFHADFSDPRLEPDENPNVVSRVEGAFEFYFERGQPAQPFP